MRCSLMSSPTRPLTALTLTILWAAAALAQEAEPHPGGAARKVSEYVNQFNTCNAGAHLDNFAIELQKEAGAEGHIVAYAPGGENGAYGRRLLNVAKNYLVNQRGLEEGRIKTVYGGRYKDLRDAVTELWLVPSGAAPPPVIEHANELDAFTGKFADYVGWDSYIEGDAESWSSSREVALNGLADMLEKRPNTMAFIVAYNHPDSPVGTWRRVARDDLDVLKARGVEPGRVKLIHGGEAADAEGRGSETARIQLWLLPKDAAPPVKEAKKEGRPESAQRLARIPVYSLEDAQTRRRALEGLTELLREDADLRAFLIVRLPSADSETALPGEPPGVDVAEVAEGWKKELQANHKVSGSRVVIVSVPPREWAAGEVEMWVAPPGMAPPDPYAEDAEAEGEQTRGDDREGAKENGSDSSDPDRAEAVRGREE
jgi:hypothetical protein